MAISEVGARFGIKMERKVGFRECHVMSATRIPRLGPKFPFVDNRNFSANRPPRNERADVKKHAVCAVNVNGGIEGRGGHWKNATCTAGPNARVLCQDHVREATWSMSGSSLNLGWS